MEHNHYEKVFMDALNGKSWVVWTKYRQCGKKQLPHAVSDSMPENHGPSKGSGQ